MALNAIDLDYSPNTAIFLNIGFSNFTQESWSQDEGAMQYLPYRFGTSLRKFDPASVDTIPEPRDITEETLGTDFIIEPVEIYSHELEENIVLPFPPAQKYTVDLTVTKITRWKPKLVVTEDLLQD